MAKTVEEGFNTFHSWLTPTATESTNAKNHRASIKACIEANLGLKRFFRTGSFGNGTSISSYSDVDYFASIPRENLKQDSNSTLRQLKSILDTRFPNTGVYIDSPAVIVPFGDDPAEATEIVPADFIERNGEYHTYDIPNGSGGWMRSSPEYHKLNIDVEDDRLSKKVKLLIRFIKAWKYYRNVPISSFYLEMYIGIYAEKEKSIIYSIDVNAIFSNLLSSNLPSINDPMGISGSISACKNQTERNTTIAALGEAVKRANNARKAETEERIQDAFYWWDKVYDGLFPSY